MESTEKVLEIAGLFREVNGMLKQSIGRRFENMGMTMTMPQGILIGILSRNGCKMKISELSQKLNLTDGTVSGIIDRLEKQGLVERSRSEEDKRVVYVSLSPRMEEIHRDFHLKTEGTMKSLLSKATPEEIDQIMNGLNILKRLMHSDLDDG
ncbi:regulatory protein MarR [Syntrophobotulus glycolicus DSM 8271]|uniref:Regulatory protein MarR n=1 Tax=Syntrophobotulus glycolicus (strain DSM 8271 / FlGlyR) TaxID=645991 RepID=F0T0F4_SYNGF|nr:MarR family transcriptional regulator [Syntrophobotulus glycolicus]ADY57326.1 regulatory protein MarR [Syntrophobotulus glycolicus DSM 8271]